MKFRTWSPRGGRRGAGSLGGVANAALFSNFSEAVTGIHYYASQFRYIIYILLHASNISCFLLLKDD